MGLGTRRGEGRTSLVKALERKDPVIITKCQAHLTKEDHISSFKNSQSSPGTVREGTTEGE